MRREAAISSAPPFVLKVPLNNEIAPARRYFEIFVLTRFAKAFIYKDKIYKKWR